MIKSQTKMKSGIWNTWVKPIAKGAAKGAAQGLAFGAALYVAGKCVSKATKEN